MIRDGNPLPGASVSYSYGPEMLPPKVEKTAPVPKEGLVVAAGTLKEPGFLRLVATAEVDGKKYRGLATAGFAPEAIKPTVEEPAGLRRVLDRGQGGARQAADRRQARRCCPSSRHRQGRLLSRQPPERRAPTATGTSRFYGVLGEPKGAGPFPALLQVPGAGVRAYRGCVEMAEKGIITLQVGIHGLPVNLDPLVYDGLRVGGRSPATRPSTSTSATATTTGACTSAACGPTTSWSRIRSCDGKTLAVTGRQPGRRALDRHRRASTRASSGSRPTTRRSPTSRAT